MKTMTMMTKINLLQMLRNNNAPIVKADEQEVQKFHFYPEDFVGMSNEEIELILRQEILNLDSQALYVKELQEFIANGAILKSAKEPTIEKHVPDVTIMTLPGRGKAGAKIAFVGSSPSKVDMILDRPFSGMIGKTISDTFLEPVGLSDDDVYLTNIVKDFCYDGRGAASEPTQKQIEESMKEFVEEIKEVAPQFIVALGKTAQSAIGQICEEWMPHPRGINMHGDTGEVRKKMARLVKKMETLSTAKPFECVISKADNEKQIVYGVVMEPLANDTDGNFSLPEDIENAAHIFMKEFRMIDTEHSKEAIDATPVESWIAPEDTELGGKTVSKGTWLMGVHIEDKDVWKKVKSGKYTGFSIDARAYIDPNVLLLEE